MLYLHASPRELYERVKARAATFAHFFAVDRQKTMHKNIVRGFAPREMEHGGPKQSVEPHNVFANKVVLLRGRMVDVGIVIFAPFIMSFA